ncbi:MAG: aminoglycoside phosphotransferase family protein [Chloroflexota bacterium]
MQPPVLEIAVLAPAADDPAVRLPLVHLARDPDDQLLAPVQHEVRTQLGIDRPALELFVPEPAAGASPIPALLVLEPGAPLGDGAPGTVGLDALAGAIVERAREWVDELAGHRPAPALRPAWARPGWTARITDWLDAQLAWAGRPREGRLEQRRTWSLSTLFRTETSDGAVWLKSCMPRFHAEPSLGRWLWEHVPEDVPGVLATDAADRLVLLEEMDGPTVKDLGGESVAPEAPAVLARIARATEDRVGELRALGLHDRPLSRVPVQLRSVLLDPEPVAAGGLSPERARAIVGWVERQAADLEGLGLPTTLVHGDFHAGNVARHQGRLVIFDWSDAVVGHPLMDAAAWIWEASDAASLAARWETWVDAWSPRVPAAELRPRLEQVLGVGAAHQLISLDGILRAMEPALRHSLAWSAVAYTGVLDRLVPRA